MFFPWARSLLLSFLIDIFSCAEHLQAGGPWGGGGHLVLIRMQPYLDYGERTNTLPFLAALIRRGGSPACQPDAAPLPTNEMTKEKKQKKKELNAVPACPFSRIGHSVAASSRTTLPAWTRRR